MRKLIFTAVLFGLSLNIYAGQVGESQMAECTESVQSPRSQETVVVSDNSSSSSESQESSASDR